MGFAQFAAEERLDERDESTYTMLKYRRAP